MIGLSLISWNANGILNKILEFKLFVEKYSPDVILIQETHLRPVHKFSVANYKCYRNDRITDGPASGGTLILIKKSIPHFNTPTPQLYYIEATTVTINPPNFDPLTITSIYVPHHSDKYLFTLDIDTIMQVNSHCVIFGDFNATHNTWNCSQNSTRGTHLKNYCDSTDFEIIFPATSTRFGYAKRKVWKDIKIDPKLSAVKLAAETSRIMGRSVSAETVRNVIRHTGYSSRIARKKPFISLQNQKKRLEFAKAHQLKTDNFWKKVIFSDESKFNIFGTDGRRTVWRKQNTALDPKNLRPTVKHGGGSVMFWDFERLDSELSAEESEIMEFEQRYFDLKLKFQDKIDAIDASRSINVSGQNISIAIPTEQSNANFRLPKLNISVFSGKFEDWKNFKDLFVTAVHSQTSLGNIQKFQYLKGLLSDEPASLIKHIPLSLMNRMKKHREN
ncbi:transposable element Tc1 transposase [Trichonephila clavipes]|nr:transposable element Tc1 transposase [Trichonephila clavipes]